MKGLQKTAQQAIWLLAVVVVIVAAIVMFPALQRGLLGPTTSQPLQTNATQTLASYPGPDIAQADATQTPAGYPGPEATEPAPDITTTSVDIYATRAAEATASMEAAPSATSVVLVGPRTIVDSTGQYSLEVPLGWWAFGDSILTNYDAAQLEDVHQFPPGGIKIQIGIDHLEGRTLDEWLDAWMAREASDEDVGPHMTFTEVQPYSLGSYAASEYFVTSPSQFIREIAFAQGDRVMIIAITPADSSAMDEALTLLSTLSLLPR